MSAARQLRLVEPQAASDQPLRTDPTAVVFDHWVALMGKRPGLCKLGPTRRQAINAMLVLYPLDIVLAAVEGLAADPMESTPPHIAEHMRDLEWLAKRESNVERYAERGLQLRDELAQRDQPSAAALQQQEEQGDAVTAEQAAACRARLAQACRAMREGRA